jgi:hypothetical protein
MKRPPKRDIKAAQFALGGAQGHEQETGLELAGR